MKIVFFGTGSFAVPSLRALASDVLMVVSQPDRPAGRGMHLKPSNAKLAATELGLRVETPEKARSLEFVEEIRSLGADALLVASYGQILSQALLESARRGGINLHGSILPQYRGAAPIQRCILAGDKETGVSLMQMDKGMDTGDVIEIRKTAIGPDETYGELQHRLAELAAIMVSDWMPKLVAGNYSRTPQDSSKASVAPKVDKTEAELRFERSADGEYDRFRAFTPAPGAFIGTSHGRIRLTKVRRLGEGGLPGTVLLGGEGCRVAFQDGSLDLLEVQPEGKRRMSGRDFMNGLRVRPGDSLR